MSNTYVRQLAATLMTFKTSDEVVDFLEAILTPKELTEIPMRLQIVKMLKKNIAQLAIAQELGVGIATVTRGSKELQKGKFNNV